MQDSHLHKLFYTLRVIALTDGEHNTGGFSKEQITTYAQRNLIVIDTIGVADLPELPKLVYGNFRGYWLRQD
jgi:hypothetical protein